MLLLLAPWLVRHKPRRRLGGLGSLVLLSASLLAVAGPALAQVDPVGPFTGHRSEGFETQQSPDLAPCVGGRVFDDTADLCAANSGGTLLVDQLPVGMCTVWPHQGGRFYTTEADAARFTFDYPVLRFGGYFSGPTPDGMPPVSVEFFDDTDALIDSVMILQQYSNCGWTWYGWESLDTDIATIEVGYSNAWVTMDGLEVDFGCDVTDDDGDGVDECGGDCNDVDPGVFPGATEVPDGLDQDCDGVVDEGTEWHDDDGDGMAEVGGDCDDTNSQVYSGAPEVCDGVDDDCDGTVDDGTECYDDDGDGFNEIDGDCNDGDPAVHPGHLELADGVDNDCDGAIDENTENADGDGDGYTTAAGDCDDGDLLTHPGAVELPDGMDNDCDGIVDEGTDVYDDDLDGYCEGPTCIDGGLPGDCNDGDPWANPSNAEIEDGIDNDCDGIVDEGFSAYDGDGDGYSTAGGDCDDSDATTYPGAQELPDGVDNDCDGVQDDNTDVYDDDGDGYTEQDGDCDDGDSWVSPGVSEVANGVDDDCDGQVDEDTEVADDDGDGFTELQGDCADADDGVYPGASELPNGVDDDCDGMVDDGTEQYDDDGDGFTEVDGDCNDGNAFVSPNRPELCDGVLDEDCDGAVDEGCPGDGSDSDEGSPGCSIGRIVAGKDSVRDATGLTGVLLACGILALAARRRHPSHIQEST